MGHGFMATVNLDVFFLSKAGVIYEPAAPSRGCNGKSFLSRQGPFFRVHGRKIPKGLGIYGSKLKRLLPRTMELQLGKILLKV